MFNTKKREWIHREQDKHGDGKEKKGKNYMKKEKVKEIKCINICKKQKKIKTKVILTNHKR